MEKKLHKTIALLAMITVVGLLALLPYRLYVRDTDVARRHAQLVSDELSNMIKLTMLTTKEVLNLDPNLSLGVVLEKINTLYRKFEENQDFKFRVVRSPIVENQYTAVKGRRADNPQAVEVLKTGRPQSKVDGVFLTYWSPIRADSQCGQCHRDKNRKKVKEGMTLGVVETVFDLTRQRERSIRTILEITGFLLVMIAIMAFVVVAVLRKNLFQPLQRLVDALNRRAEDPDTSLPKYSTPEMSGLIDAIEGQTNRKAESAD